MREVYFGDSEHQASSNAFTVLAASVGVLSRECDLFRGRL